MQLGFVLRGFRFWRRGQTIEGLLEFKENDMSAQKLPSKEGSKFDAKRTQIPKVKGAKAPRPAKNKMK